MRRPGCSARASTSGGRPTALTSSTSASGQPSRAQASASAEGCGWTCRRPGPEAARERRADAVQHRVAAREHAGLAPARRCTSSSSSASIGDGHGAPHGGGRGQQRELPLRADDHLGGEHRGARGLAEPGPAVGADADDDERRRAHATRDVSRRPRARGGSAICGKRRPVHVQEARLHAAGDEALAALASRARRASTRPARRRSSGSTCE